MKRTLISLVGLIIGFISYAQINIAGVYEGQMNDNITRKRMYLNVDFINNVPDFTRIFTEKQAPLNILPKDFMNAKKLKKQFAGQMAPAFARYNSKTIFSETEEIKIFNPTIENGIVTAEWENHEGAKGRCFIIIHPDRSLQILGLTTLHPDLGPDNLVLSLQEDKLPAGATPYITPSELLPLINKRYCREILWKAKVNRSNGIPHIPLSVDVSKVRRIGNNVLVPVTWNNKNSKPIQLALDIIGQNEYATVNGTDKCGVYTADINPGKTLDPNDITLIWYEITGVPLNAQKLDNFKIKGRAPDSPRSTEKNPYGDFEYVIEDVVIPELKPSNYEGCFTSDGDLIVIVDNVTSQDKDLVIDFRLANDSNRDKKIYSNEAIARTPSGEEFQASVQIPEDLYAESTIKCQVTVKGAARETLKMVRIPIKVNERQIYFNALIQLSNISVNR